MAVLNKKISGIPANAVYIGRGSKWGNTFTHLPNIANTTQVKNRDEAVDMHLAKLEADVLAGKITLQELAELHNKDLVCFCAPLRCHGDNLVKAAKYAFDKLKENKPKHIAIIGTAGRDKTKPMTKALWQWMVNDIQQRITPNDTLVSGGAAWADHLAVEMLLTNKCKGLLIHLPAPYSVESKRFIGPSHNSAASAANYYHQLFSNVVGYNTLAQIADTAIHPDTDGTFEPESEGFSAMFARNRKVAANSQSVIAYTFGTGNEPADGGTKHTWDMCKGTKTHVTLPIIY